MCGSAAVLFAKAPSRHEILNVVGGDVVNFLRVLRTRPAVLAAMCRLSPYSRDKYTACANLDDPSIDDFERARRRWVRSSQSSGQIHKINTGSATNIEHGSNNARSL